MYLFDVYYRVPCFIGWNCGRLFSGTRVFPRPVLIPFKQQAILTKVVQPKENSRRVHMGSSDFKISRIPTCKCAMERESIDIGNKNSVNWKDLWNRWHPVP